ncbi:hypothetical protein SAMN05444339_11011 [Loktanella atrilutea]|uniref:Uncharacterized protein n=1 Tax=Loktanella atrilutea TaxID=366533 RepID=A0A1M5DJ40_LOKAT|nr:hypothetical protein [Loktanella atrilutea]SHF66911.1 hypothetical protein SAMN05444339_11011 [Loktanella atrilutea]
MPFTPPTPQMVRDARAVVLDPNSRPHTRTHAWAVLKSARGQQINQSRINQMQVVARGLSILTGGAA